MASLAPLPVPIVLGARLIKFVRPLRRIGTAEICTKRIDPCAIVGARACLRIPLLGEGVVFVDTIPEGRVVGEEEPDTPIFPVLVSRPCDVIAAVLDNVKYLLSFIDVTENEVFEIDSYALWIKDEDSFPLFIWGKDQPASSKSSLIIGL